MLLLSTRYQSSAVLWSCQQVPSFISSFIHHSAFPRTTTRLHVCSLLRNGKRIVRAFFRDRIVIFVFIHPMKAEGRETD